MRPALTLSTRRAKSSNCLLKQCYFELERNQRSFLTCQTTPSKKTAATAISNRPQLPALWFLVTRSSSTHALLKHEESKNQHDAAEMTSTTSSNHSNKKKFHPRNMNKDTHLDSLLHFLATGSLTPKEIFKSLRTALYNTTQYDSKKAWLIYENMVHYRVDKYLKSNHYGYLLCILKYDDKSVPKMLEILENIKKQQQQQLSSPPIITSYHISQILFAMSKQGLVKEACDLVKSTSLTAANTNNIDLYPTANHYHSLAIALKNSKDNTLLQQVTQLMLEGMEQRETTLHNTTLSTMISLLSKQSIQPVESTLQFLKAMDGVNLKKEKECSNHNHPYNVYIYTSLIAGFARQGDSESAKRLFDEMKKHKITPNQVTFATLMEAYSKAGDFTSAIRLLTDYTRRHKKISNAMVTSLIVNAIQQNNLTVAENAAKFIAKKKLKVKDMDSMLRTALIWLKTKSDVDQARKDFDTLYKMDKDLVNNIMVNHLVLGYGEKKDKEGVINSYNLHNSSTTTATIEQQMRSQHYLTNALFHCRDVPAAMGVFVSMRNQGVPDDITLAMVIQGLIMNNEHILAWRLFKTLQADGIEPNLHAYTSILKAIGHRDTDIKKKHITNGSNSSLSPDMVTAAGMEGLGKDYLHSAVPSTTEALNIFRRMTGFQQPNVYTYTTLISCFAKHNITRAISIFDHMCAQGVAPTVETYTAILQGCAIFRNSQLALTIFSHMCERRIEPNAVTWRYLLKSLLRSRVDKLQIEKVAQMAKKSIDSSSSQK